MADKSTKSVSTATSLNKILAANITQWMKDDCRFVLMFCDSSMKTFYALLFIDVKDSPLWGAELIYKFKLPDNFPHDPPSVECLTPNGQMDLGGPICLGIGEWHKDQWRGSLGIVGFVNYVWCCMTNMDQVEHGIRIIKNTPPNQLRKHAQESREYNRVDPSTHAVQADFETKIRDYPNIPAIRALQALRGQATKAPPHKSDRASSERQTMSVTPKTMFAEAAAAATPTPPAPPANGHSNKAMQAQGQKIAPSSHVNGESTKPLLWPQAPISTVAAQAPQSENTDVAFDDYMAALGL